MLTNYGHPFSAEKKKGQNWFQKQFSRKTTGDYDSRGMEHAAAVAAAAFAINLQEVTEQKNETPEASLTKTKSKVDGTKSPFSQLSKRFSGKDENIGTPLINNIYHPLWRKQKIKQV